MILRTIRIRDFRQLQGENLLSFASGAEGNVTVVLGENGSGKTTLLNAFAWCLYGEAQMENADELLNYHTLLEAKDGEKLQASVELSFESGGSHYTFLREQEYVKSDSAAVAKGKAHFAATVKGPSGETTSVNDPLTTVERLLPPNLSKFFFFRGEDVEALASHEAEKELREGVESFLALEMINRAGRHLKRVEKGLNKSLKEDARGELKSIQTKIEAVDADIEEATLKREEAEKEIAALKQHESRIDEQLAKFEDIRPKLDERKQLLGQRTELKRRKDQSESELLKVLSSDGFLAFADASLRRPEELADEAVTRGDLPARIKPQFVDDIIEKEVCICGVSITPDMRSSLLEWREISGLAALEESIGRMRGDVKGLRARRQQFDTDLTARKSAMDRLTLELHDLDERISRLNAEIGDPSGVPEIRKLQDRRREIHDQLGHVHTQLGRHQQYLDDLNKEKEEHIKERRSLQTLSDKERVLEHRIEVVRAVSKGFESLRAEWSEVIRGYINEDLNETWARIAQLERRLEFTAEYSLSMKERAGDRDRWVESAPSSANRRAMALAFISSLIRLAGEIAEEETPTGFFEGGDYPLVMDAPFATMDRYFKTQIPRGLAEVVPQIVLISSYDQFEGEVATEMGPRAGRWYVLELHRTDSQGKDLNIPLNGRTVPYVIGEQGAVTDWTVVKEISA